MTCTYSNQVNTQNLTHNYTIIIHTNLNINLYSSLYIQISETTFSKFMIKVTQIYDKFRKKHIYHKFRSTFMIDLSQIYDKFSTFMIKVDSEKCIIARLCTTSDSFSLSIAIQKFKK